MSPVRVDARTSYSLVMSLKKSAVGSVRVPLFCEKCHAKGRAQGAVQLTMQVGRSILSMMGNSTKNLDRTFAALGDPTRRAILERLAQRASATVSELAEPFAIKLPAVMKHLGVLDEAGLITRAKSGRVVTVRLRPGSMREAMAWLRRRELFWSAR
jgi:DNA-binding transcriptional ArsR family regulator